MKAFDINLEEIENNIKNHIITRLEEYEDRGLFIYKNACNEWLLEYSETTDLPAFIDILVDEGEASGLSFFKLQNDLSKALSKTVDLQSVNAENKEFLNKIEKDRIQIYAA